MGYSPLGRRQSDTTERLHFTAQSSLTLCDPKDYTVLTKLSFVVYFIVQAQSHLTVTGQAPLFKEFSSRNTRVTCHFLLRGIFLTQGSNEEDSFPLSHLGNTYFIRSINSVKVKSLSRV